jgi:multiple antibiotic resistance protein
MALSAFLIMLIGGFVGMELLNFFWLEMRYFRVAWWILIAYNAFLMVTGSLPAGHHDAGSSVDDIAWRGLIIPLTMPLVAGPGSIAYLISMFAYGVHFYIPIIIAICIGSICFYLIIRYSFALERILWKIGIALITRFMGLLLLWIGIQSIMMNL